MTITSAGPASPSSKVSASAASQESSRLQKACQDFEAVFLTMIWREMLKSTKTDLGGYETFAEQAIGDQWAQSGGIGLAKVICRSMSKYLSN